MRVSAALWPVAHGNPNAAANFTWTDVEVCGNGATSAPDNSICSFVGDIVISGIGGQTISSLSMDCFTCYDSGITSDPAIITWSRLDGSNNFLAGGVMKAVGGLTKSALQIHFLACSHHYKRSAVALIGADGRFQRSSCGSVRRFEVRQH